MTNTVTNHEKYDVFISYARADAQRDKRILDIVDRLEQAGLRVWMDRDISAQYISFSENIATIIKNSKRVLLFVGDDMPNSSYVASEINYARIQGCKIFVALYAVKNKDNEEYLSLVPARYQKKQAFDFVEVGDSGEAYETKVAEVIRDLSAPIVMGDLSSNFKSIPPGYIPRYEFIDEMEDKLYSGMYGVRAKSVGGFYGRAGIGKSVMANAFCREAEVRGQFPDGIMWLDVKESGNLTYILEQLHTEYNDIPLCFEEEDIKRCIHRFFADKKMLVVLDDVWEHSSGVLQFFAGIFSLSECKVLVTSRDRAVIKAYTTDELVEIKELTQAEAVHMMLRAEKDDLPFDTHLTKSALDPDAAAIFDYVQGHTLSIVIVCAMRRDKIPWKKIRRDIERQRDMIEQALLERNLPDYDYKDALTAIKVSVDALGENNHYYRKLAVLPRNSGIRLEAAKVLWKSINPNITDRQAEKIIRKLNDKCLVIYDEDSNTLYLHDLEYDYLAVTSVQEINGLHKEFVIAYQQMIGGDWINGPDDGYYYQHIVYHMLCNSDCLDTAGALLTDYAWIKKKITLCGCASILQDYRFAETHRPANHECVHAIGRCVFLAGPFLSADPRQLPTHFVGRLKDIDDPFFEGFLDSIYQHEKDFWLRPMARCMMSPYSDLTNQWTVDAGASALACQGNRLTVATRGNAGKIYLFGIDAYDSEFVWEANTAVLAVAVDDNTVLSGDDKGNVDRWMVGDPLANRMLSLGEPILYIGKRDTGELLVGTAGGTVWLQHGDKIMLDYPSTVTAYHLYKDSLYVGYEDGHFVILDVASGTEVLSVDAYKGCRIESICACDAYVAIKVINSEKEDEPMSRIAILDDYLFGRFREVLCLHSTAGGLSMADPKSTGDAAMLLYTDGIHVNAYSDNADPPTRNVAINEHWVIKFLVTDNNIICSDNYGHICCFDMANSLHNSFNAYDSFVMRTMVNKESFGSLQLGIRGVSVDKTDSIVLPDYRIEHGINPVVFCMAKVQGGIVYADRPNGVCLFAVGQKQPVQVPKRNALPLCALGYGAHSAVGYEDGAIFLYDLDGTQWQYCTIPTAVNILCTDGNNLYCASGRTIYAIHENNYRAIATLPAIITHIHAHCDLMFVVYGNNTLECRRIQDGTTATIHYCTEGRVPNGVAEAFAIASYVIFFDAAKGIMCDPIGDFQVQYNKSMRHNSKDRKVLCMDDKVLYCDNTTDDNFGLIIKQIGHKNSKVLQEISSSVYLSILSVDKYLVTASQKDEICFWNKHTWKPVRTINTDSILRMIDVIDGHIAFVSGSHIFWLKIENWDNL